MVWLKRWRRSLLGLALLSEVVCLRAAAQTCLTQNDMDEPVRAALESAGKRYFEMAAHADAAGMKQSAIPSLAADFSSIETAVKDNQANFADAQAQPRPAFLLKVEGEKPLERAEFLCGVFGKNGQTANSAAFVIPNLPPGTYGVATFEIARGQKPQTVSFVLQEQGTDWKIGGFYVHASQLAGHDSEWFAEKARAFKTKGQSRNAWLYFLEARELAAPVSFMYTQTTDKLYDESQACKPADVPSDGTTVGLAATGKSYTLTSMLTAAVGQDLDVVVKYQAASLANSSETLKENIAVIHALVAKYPELRDGFGGVVARAVAPSGQDYGAMLPMNEIK